MPLTPNFNLPYPGLGDPPNGPEQLRALAEETDTALYETKQALTPSGGRQTLPDLLTLSALPTNNTWGNWGSSLILPNPGVSCLVYAWGTGWFLNDNGGTVGRMRVSISLDGGATWSTGLDVSDQAGSVPNGGGTSATRRGSFSPVHFEQGTPSSNVMIKAECLWSDGGLGGDPDFYSGSVVGLVLPLAV